MNPKPQRAGQNQRGDSSKPKERGSARTAILVVSGLAVGLLLLILALNFTSGTKPAAEAIPADRLQQLAKKQIVSPTRQEEPSGEQTGIVPSPRRTTTSAQSPQAPQQPESVPYLQQLVANLAKIDLSAGAMTPQQVAQWKQNLQQLKQQGSAAFPAIREFLDKNLDVNFRGIADTRSVGYDTLRTALIDTMQQIGGPESVSAALQTLQTTADPTEIAMLGKYLMQQSPAEYRETALTAAREAFAQAAAGGLGNRDMNALFEFVQRYGDASMVADLEKYAPQWSQYVPMALANLPDAAGIPALIRLAGDPGGTASGSREAALRSLAEVATRYPEAGNALLDQARGKGIQNSSWPAIASALAGNTLAYGNSVFPDPRVGQSDTQTYRVSTGDQKFLGVSSPGSLSAAQVRERINYIDQLLSATSNPSALQALYGARASLVARPAK